MQRNVKAGWCSDLFTLQWVFSPIDRQEPVELWARQAGGLVGCRGLTTWRSRAAETGRYRYDGGVPAFLPCV